MASKDQGRSHEIVGSKVHQTRTLSQMNSEFYACTQEGWKGKDLCGLWRPK